MVSATGLTTNLFYSNVFKKGMNPHYSCYHSMFATDLTFFLFLNTLLDLRSKKELQSVCQKSISKRFISWLNIDFGNKTFGLKIHELLSLICTSKMHSEIIY